MGWGAKKPKAIKRCLNTWKKHLEGYEIIEWNENNFDINSHSFTIAAHKAEKWAYVSDYIRAFVINKYGGIYLDTDVILLDNFNDFLGHRAFVGYETPIYPFTAVFGAEKGHPLVKDILNYYDNNEFSFDSNNQLKVVNTKIVSDILINKYGCKLGNIKQELKDGIMIYPDYVLCNPSIDSVSIHIFTGTWLEGKKPIFRILNTFLKLRLTSKRRAHLYHKYITKKKEI